jgi:hypothetical protein
MATMTRHVQRSTTDTTRGPLTAALDVLALWIAAASAVAVVHLQLEARWPRAGALATSAAILFAAWCSRRFSRRDRGPHHALGVGIAWLLLTIVTELVVTARLGHGWYALLGSPAHPLLRNVNLFLWIFAPSFFAHREVNG